MERINFFGPVDLTFGPGIKNKYTIDHLKQYYDIKIYNTRNASFLKKIFLLIRLFFSRKKTIIGVSSKGRKTILPFLYFKKKIYKKFEYAAILINGYIGKEIEMNRKYVKYLQLARCIFVEIEQLKLELEQKYQLKNVYYFPNFKPTQYFVTKETISNFNNNLFKCVFLARVCKAKGVPSMIEAFRRINNEFPDITLDIYGPIDDDCIDLVTNLPKGVFYKGVVENNQVTNVLSLYNIFVFPTQYKYEGFPASIVDAYSAGLPVISSDVAYLSYIVKDDINGVIISDLSFESFYKSVKYFYENRALLKTIALNNYELSYSFAVDNVFKRFINDLKKVGW